MSLLETIHAGDIAKALEQVAAGADANELGSEGETPLIAAAAAGHVELVRRLLEHGADPALIDGTEETALLKAAALGQRKVYELLAPHASQDDRDAAAAYLRASGQSSDGLIDGPPSEPLSKVRSTLVQVTARTAKFLGDENPQERVERVQRAEKHRK